MGMDQTRRKLLRLAAALPVSLPVFSFGDSRQALTSFFYPVNTPGGSRQPGKGAIVLVDAGVSQFNGEGLYLYPDWGQPVVYEIKKTGRKLLFYYPGNTDLLWTITANSPEARFCGRICGVVDNPDHLLDREDVHGVAEFQLLTVPELPPA